jgi:hypothetical protein
MFSHISLVIVVFMDGHLRFLQIILKLKWNGPNNSNRSHNEVDKKQEPMLYSEDYMDESNVTRIENTKSSYCQVRLCSFLPQSIWIEGD